MLLTRLNSDVEEEKSRLTNEKLSLEESCEQVTKFLQSPERATSMWLSRVIYNGCICFLFVCLKVDTNISDKSNDLKQLREQIRKLDEWLDSDMQVCFYV